MIYKYFLQNIELINNINIKILHILKLTLLKIKLILYKQCIDK